MNAGVSVIIPVFNGERFLRAALESVFAQTLAVAEVIVVDDGSTDSSVQRAKEFRGVTLLELPHGGVSKARNVGVARSTGNQVAFLDADDTWAPRKLERQLAMLALEPAEAVVMCNQGYRFEGPIPAWFRGPMEGGHEPGFMPSCWLMPRHTWERVGPFNESMTHSEDTDWLARARDLGVSTPLVPDVLVTHRIHDRNASGMPHEVRNGVLAALRSSVQRKRGSSP